MSKSAWVIRCRKTGNVVSRVIRTKIEAERIARKLNSAVEETRYVVEPRIK